MPARSIPVDFVAYNPDGTILLLAEAKIRRGTSPAWAAQLRRNMFAHRSLPKSQFFLIATPESIYGWREIDSRPDDSSAPGFIIDAQEVFRPYFSKYQLDPASIAPEPFSLVVGAWLTDLTSLHGRSQDPNPSLRPFADSGLLPSLRHAEIETNSAT